MQLKLAELYKNDLEAKELTSKNLTEGLKDVEDIHQHQSHLNISEIVCPKLISCHFDNLLVGYFEIKKAKELVTKKYFWFTLKRDVKTYIKDGDVYLTSKVIQYKLYLAYHEEKC